MGHTNKTLNIHNKVKIANISLSFRWKISTLDFKQTDICTITNFQMVSGSFELDKAVTKKIYVTTGI